MAILFDETQLNTGDDRHDESETIVEALISSEGYRGVSKKNSEINSPILTVRRGLFRHKVMRFLSTDVYVILLATT